MVAVSTARSLLLPFGWLIGQMCAEVVLLETLATLVTLLTSLKTEMELSWVLLSYCDRILRPSRVKPANLRRLFVVKSTSQTWTQINYFELPRITLATNRFAITLTLLITEVVIRCKLSHFKVGVFAYVGGCFNFLCATNRLFKISTALIQFCVRLFQLLKWKRTVIGVCNLAAVYIFIAQDSGLNDKGLSLHSRLALPRLAGELSHNRLFHSLKPILCCLKRHLALT